MNALQAVIKIVGSLSGRNPSVVRPTQEKIKVRILLHLPTIMHNSPNFNRTLRSCPIISIKKLVLLCINEILREESLNI